MIFDTSNGGLLGEDAIKTSALFQQDNDVLQDLCLGGLKHQGASDNAILRTTNSDVQQLLGGVGLGLDTA